MEKLEECQTNKDKWPQDIKTQFDLQKRRLERQIHLTQSIPNKIPPTDNKAKINQLQMMYSLYHIIQDEIIWQMVTTEIIKNLKWHYPTDNTIACCKAKIKKAEHKIKSMNKIINSYKQNVEHADNSCQIIKDKLDNLALKSELKQMQLSNTSTYYIKFSMIIIINTI